MSDAAPPIDIHPLTPERWDDFVELFERPGPRGGRQVSSACWCMYWRIDYDTFRSGWGKGANRGAGNKACMQALVALHSVPGLLAYADGRVVGWISIAPREEFTRLDASRALARVDDTPVWSVTCFYIPRTERRHGLGRALLQGAVAYAAAQGAEAVEAYGCKPDDSDPFTGFNSMFEAAGFTLARAGGRRSIWRHLCPA